MTNSTKLLSAIAVILPGCCSTHPRPDPIEICANASELSALVLGVCPPQDCGHNSPVANTFPINGFSSQRGFCNKQGVQIIPGSLRGGECPAEGADLDINAAGQLIGKINGRECTVSQGAELAVRRKVPAGLPPTVVLTVADVRSFDVEDEQGVIRRYTGYKIVADGQQLCDPIAARTVRERLLMPYESRPDVTIGPPHTNPYDDLVIPVAGELYDLHDERIQLRGAWFNLACAGDALAKMTFYHLRGTDPLKNQSALRLLTGNYCGSRAYTVRGMTIGWVKRLPNDTEAVWHQGKALCLKRPRLMQLQESVTAPTMPEDLPDSLQPEGCRRKGSARRGSCNEANWISTVRRECRIPECTNETGEFISLLEGASVLIDTFPSTLPP